MNRTLMALGAAALLSSVPAPAQEAAASDKMTLEDVLAGYYEAIGGLEAWGSVSSARMVGSMRAPNGFEAPFTLMFKVPGKSRLEFTFEGLTGVQAVDGDAAWQIMPFMGKPDPETMPRDQARLMIEQADFDGPLVNWKEDGNTLEYLGVEDVEDTDVHKVKVTLASGDVRHYFLDAESFLPLRSLAQTRVQGQEIAVETTFDDYKEIGGLVLPHTIEVRQVGAPDRAQVFTIAETELNVELDDGQFRMPGAGG